MSIHEIEAALSELSAEDLVRVENSLRAVRARRTGMAAKRNAEQSALTNGFDIFQKRNGEQVTIELVRQLCVEEGI